jgi:hypothetical protein
MMTLRYLVVFFIVCLYGCADGGKILVAVLAGVAEADLAKNCAKPGAQNGPGCNRQVSESSASSSIASGATTSGSCNWFSATQAVQIIKNRRGSRCGAPDSHEVEIRNASGVRIKTLVYIQSSTGRWIKNADGTFNSGMEPGKVVNHYACSGTGQMKIAAMPLQNFLQSNCNYPEYGAW